MVQQLEIIFMSMILAEGHLSVLDYLLKEKPQILTLNIGTGKGNKCFRIYKKF